MVRMRTGIHADRLHYGARQTARPWVESLARAGYAAKGVLYVTIGALALMLAVGEGGRTAGSKDALAALGEQPFGQILLVVMAVGLAGYALWNAVQGTIDPEGEARSSEHPGLKRAGFITNAVIHVGLVVYAVQLAIGQPTQRGGEAQSLSARLMNWEPLGVWLVALLGAIVVGFGLHQLKKAWTGDITRKLSLERVSWKAREWIVRFGRFGTAARGSVFAIAGVFLVVAALTADPGRAKGIGETLGWLSQQSYGDLLLVVTSLGLLAYGLFQFVVARYRVIRPI